MSKEIGHMTHPRINKLLKGAITGVLLCANLFLFIAFTVFQANAEELSTSFFDIFLLYLKPIAIIVGFCCAVACILPEKFFRFFIALLAMTAILIWLQGNLFIWDYGLFDGRKIKWENEARIAIFELFVWAGGLIFVLLTFQKSFRPLFGFTVTLGILQSLLFIYQWIDYTPPDNNEAARTDAKEIERNIFSYSPDSNIVHIIADGFQIDIVAELLGEGEFGESLKRSLSGFTYFNDNVAAFPYTHMSVPAILSGKHYRNHIPIRKFQDQALREDSVIAIAKNSGHEVDVIVEPGALTRIYSQVPHDNLYPLSSKVHLNADNTNRYDALRLFDYSLFRSVPHVLKEKVHNKQRWFTQSVFFKNEFTGQRNFAQMAFLRDATARMRADRKKPVYKIFHLMLSHTPMVTTSKCRYAGEVFPTIRTNVINQVRCSLIELQHFLDKMKSLDIYDKSTIILMGDHGAWVRPKNAKDIINTQNQRREFIAPNFMGLSSSVLAIKPPHNDHPFRFSESPTSIIDTARTIATISGFDHNLPGENVFDIKEDADRERTFIYYKYDRSEWRDNHLSTMYEYSIARNGVDSASWQYKRSYDRDGKNEVVPGDSVLWMSSPISNE